MRICEHVKTDGTTCSSPALRGRRRCYFHYQQKSRINRMEDNPCIPFPVLEDAQSIQAAIMQVIDRLNMRTIEYRAAALMLYGLKIAAMNSKRAQFDTSYADYAVTLPKEDQPKPESALPAPAVQSPLLLPHSVEPDAPRKLSESSTPNPLDYIVDVARLRQ